jgi:hypothetical protein
LKPDTDNELPLKAFLLGELNPEEHLWLEQHLMTEETAFEELQIAEDELIDDYLTSSLSGIERENFDKLFLLTPQRQQKLGIARALKRYVKENGSKKSRWAGVWQNWRGFWHFRNPILSWSLAASLLLILLGGPYLMLKVSRLQMAPTSISMLLAAPGQSRDAGGAESVFIPAGTDLLRVELPMDPEDYSRFRVVLVEIDSGDEVYTQIFPKTESMVQDQALKFSITAEPLVYGDYVLRLNGAVLNGDFESIDSYSFRVIRD